ncbi:MAG TPA: AAA family ATPase [Candidatus Binataceae bacterium]|nr:AAA family ATPase [Candidatus Binataceae bacterium]
MARSGTVTLLFTDLVNSTSHLQDAGDEAGQRFFRAHHKLITDAVTGCGGEELQWLGDGVLAAFGSTADAVRSAIKIQQTARRPIGNVRFEIRIGIHSGEAMRREEGYFGAAVVIARRLCDRAEAGQILCSTMVANLLNSRHAFTFGEIGPLQLKGIVEPIVACEVHYERNDPVALLNRTPFVGRAVQMERLLAKLELASNGHGAVAMLVGEPGIGKTRALEEFSDVARQRNAIVLRGACYDGEFQRPYGPFAEVIGAYAQAASLDHLKKVLGHSASTIARIAPGLRHYLGDVPEPSALDKDEERFRLLDAVAQSLISIAQLSPLVLILDDLHWADRGTVAMLNHVGHFVASNPILLIGAYRDSEVGRLHPLSAALAAIRRTRDFESIALEGLGATDVAELLGIIGDQTAPAQLVQTLEAETDGNPFFIREVLLHLVEEGKILSAGQSWTSELSIEELGIPEGVREIIERRLMRLSDDARSLLTVGAAFKGEFSFDVAASVAGLSDDAALSATDEALEAQLLRPGTVADNFDFTHALIRHSLYSQLNPARRIRLHRRIAETMDRQWGDEAAEHAAEVAYHFWRGAAALGREHRGVDYAIAAANYAEKAYAYDELASFLRIAIELLSATDPRRQELLVRLGTTLTWTQQEQEALTVINEVAGLIETASGPGASADYLETAARSMHFAGLASGSWELARKGLERIGERRDITWASLAELDRIRIDASDPESHGIRRDSPELREWRATMKRLPIDQVIAHGIEPAFDSREETLRTPEAPASCLTFLAGDYRRSLSIWEHDAGDQERMGRIVKAMSSWANVARCYIAIGDFAAGQAAYDRACALSARTTGQSGHHLSLASVKQEMLIALDCGWESMLGESSYISQPSIETRWAFASICSTAAYIFARLGNSHAALQWLSMVPPALEVGAPCFPIYGIAACNAAFALWLMNRTDHAEIIERNLRDRMLPTDFRPPMRDCRLSIARLCALQNRPDEARQWFAAARIALDEQGARPMRAIVDFDEALMFIRRGCGEDRERAKPLLCCALNQFKELAMTGWIKRAGDLMSENSPSSS